MDFYVLDDGRVTIRRINEKKIQWYSDITTRREYHSYDIA